MHRLPGTFCTALIVSLLVSSGTAVAVEGYTYSLFDGQSLAGWNVENDCEAVVDDGVLRLKAGNGWLRTDRLFGDFLLHVEWKAEKKSGYDAGIYLRALPGGKPFPKTGYQANLLQGKEGNIGRLPGAESSGLIKAGEWNTFEITVTGDSVSMVINDKPAYQASGLKVARGHLGLQCEVPKGGEFLFRNLTVTEIGYRSLFNGKDLAGWEGAGRPAEACWTVDDGAITCSGKKGPWLRSREEFDDFCFRFDYMVSPGGNSGIYVRVPKNGNHHRDHDKLPPAGFEVQILDDSAPKYAKLKDYQYCGGVYDIVGANPRVSRSPGRWNTMEIQCRGHHVTVTHNGVPIVDASPEKYPLLLLRQTKGFLGLQNHSSIVRFRNLRIGPPEID